MEIAEVTYRTTYGSAYGYNERFGVRDKHTSRGRFLTLS